MPPQQRAKPARKSARCGVGDGSPRPHPPHPQPVGSGPRPHARNDEWSGAGERPTPDAPHPGKRRPPPGTHVPPPQRAKPARRSARCGVGDGSPRPHPPHPQPLGRGPRLHARKDKWSGVGERLTPDAPHPGKRRPPPGTLMPPGQHAKPARKSARCWLGDGSPRPQPPHPQPVGSGPLPHAPTDERLGLGERPNLEAPHSGKRRPPRAPTCRPHSAQSQLVRARAVGLVKGPHARNPLSTASGWWAPAARPKGRVVGGGRAPDPGRTTPRQEAPPPGTLMPPPQRAKPARQSVRCGVGDGSPLPHPPHKQPLGSGPRPHARTDERSGVGERPTPDAPHPGKMRPPRAPSRRPHSAQSWHARVRAVGLMTGPHTRTPRTHSQWVVGPGRTPTRTNRRGWESALPRMPHTQARCAPQGHPHAAPTARKAGSQECALWGW